LVSISHYGHSYEFDVLIDSPPQNDVREVVMRGFARTTLCFAALAVAAAAHGGELNPAAGAKDEEAVLLIVGEGPATGTPAEDK
jgi:hypothetical protein